MKKEELLEIRKIYKEEMKRKMEMIKLLNTKSVKRYIDIMGYGIPTIELNEDIMMKILKNVYISSNDIYINYGIHITYDEDSPYEQSILLKPADLNGKVIKDQLMMHIIREYDIENIYYALGTGEFINYPYTMQIPDNPVVIMLSSVKNQIKNLGEYDGTNGCIHSQNRLFNRVSNKNEILRSQYFIKLMNEDQNNVLEYYSNPNNLDEIENNMCKYYKMRRERIGDN